jgi:TrmH family RNA methyltransferase
MARVVLVEPMFPGNVGAVSRVMANFGLLDLVLVSPSPGVMEDPSLLHRARAGAGVAQTARVVDTLEEALQGAHLTVGFSARPGKRRGDGDLEPRAAVQAAAGEVGDGLLAAVFGREDDGLSTGQVERCDWVVRIPTTREASSMNLAQAVAVFCYEWRLQTREPLPPPTRRLATVADRDALSQHVERVLDRVGFLRGHNRERMLVEARRFLWRRSPTAREVLVLRGMLRMVETALDRRGA